MRLSEYGKIHSWLRGNFGKATKCESPTCKGGCNTFHWAVKREREYDYDRSAFWQLCASCHSKYDRRKPYPKSVPVTYIRVRSATHKLLKIRAAHEGLQLIQVFDKLI